MGTDLKNTVLHTNTNKKLNVQKSNITSIVALGDKKHLDMRESTIEHFQSPNGEVILSIDDKSAFPQEINANDESGKKIGFKEN